MSAIEIALALAQPEPTRQQQSVIEAPLSPALVVAGAGSGKTETMANRVLWLLANDLVKPSEILGLTFTRKAAGELASRIRERIAALAAAGLLGGGYDPFEAPTVSTYNSFANSLYRDNAAVLGRESDGAVLGEGAAWQLARTTISRSAHPGLADLDSELDTVVAAVLTLSRALSENVADPAAVADFAREFRGIAELPAGNNRAEFAGVVALAGTVGALETLIDLAGEYTEAKARRGYVEYSDQVAFALDILARDPRIIATERDKFRVVLLDEYQDTSVVQTRMLARLFAGHPVMAVGDPNQSIYGWRGASASNLDDFAATFGAGGEVGHFALSTSWRNGTEILAAANTIVAPFTSSGRVRVKALTASETASSRSVDSIFVETVTDEAREVALWLKARLSHPRDDGQPASAAILFRARKTQRHFLAALREHSVKFHVLGVGGLMSQPEIADLVCALTVVNDPSAGLELLRLLAGSRWRIGVQDLFALNRLASWLRDRDYALHRYDESLASTLRASVAEGEGGSIVDALDFIGTAKSGHTALEHFSAVGLERLRDAAQTFAKLRAGVGLDLPDFAAFVLHELQLDIEVIANESRSTGMAAIDAFYDAIDSYFALDDESTLSGFLAWLREAERREDLSPRPESPEPGTVQILTIHGAKGLEWDHVVVPRLVEDELPGTPASGGYLGWLGFGQLPWEFRGDAAELPVFGWRSATTRKEVDTELADFKARVRLHLEAEERRLAYVAVTRARHSLLLSGSFWATQIKPRLPSRYLRELADSGVIPSPPEGSAQEVNPLGDELELITWPFDPLGGRRAKVEAAADAVRTAMPALAGGSRRELELLLEERRRRLDSGGLVEVPVRVPASRFKDFVSAPASVAADLRRPMPERPYRATQLGTLFHSWVEDRYATGGDSDELDALPTERDSDDFVDAAKLAELTATFERSPWADRKPVEVELEIHLPFDRNVVICKIDAVYESAGRFEIVDWKTGRPPHDAQDLEEKQLQLALYRLAFAKWKGIDPQLIDAVFYFVGDDLVIRPEHIFTEAELLDRWRAVVR